MTDTIDQLWRADHPGYATEGMRYTNLAGAPRDPGTNYSGEIHHLAYPTWQDFKDGIAYQFNDGDLTFRRRMGVPEEHLQIKNPHESLHQPGDIDLLYRWDLNEITDDEDHGTDHYTLRLYFVNTRRAYLCSIEISVVQPNEDGDAIKTWLDTQWIRMMRMWSPISGWPVNNPKPHEALEHASCVIALLGQSRA